MMVQDGSPVLRGVTDVILGLFSTGGRADRSWYLWHILLDDLAMFTMILGVVLIEALTGSPLLILPAVGIVVAGIAAGICVTIKRLHDLERPGWHWWLLMVPLYNLYLGFSLLFQKGIDGPNRFGRNPLDIGPTLLR
jgi:uncharacterized membrane protein YhaH (DUF805 family)